MKNFSDILYKIKKQAEACFLGVLII